ncbi:MAG TPA: CRISPR-associated endonuclease Cas1 [Herpetosiphonaceae bacterium]|nr:CRISPR-associated endonuclease Cas1 [Herpetosiphonaceae bacterium]
MELIVEEFGTFVRKHQGRLRVQKDKQVLQEVPLLHLEQVLIVGGGIGISSDAIRACCEQGTPIHFLSSLGRAEASLYSAGLTGTVQTRRAQLRAYDDERGVRLALAFAAGKLHNQANLLRYAGKYRKETAPAVYDELTLLVGEVLDHERALAALRGPCVDELRETILSIEAHAAQRYWAGIKLLVPPALDWPGREGRGALDPFNSALNYGYGILAARVERSLVLAGLDPYGGFVHADRPGKASLVFDLIEEFRQAVVDRTILGLVTRGVEIEQDEDGRLVEATRRKLAEKLKERMDATELYEGKRQPLRIILQCQARHIATFLRGDRPDYTPFVAGW